jgi:hypothetical protein
MPSLAALRCSLLLLAVAAPPRALGYRVFSQGQSQSRIGPAESVYLNHTVSDPSAFFGVIHMWWTGGASSNDNTTLRFYLDGAASPSIELQVARACGVGFGDESAPWGNRFFGHGAATTGWSNAIPIPFGASVVVTASNPVQTENWLYVRGVEMPLAGPGLSFGGSVTLPTSARLQLQVVRGTFAPLSFVDVAAVDPAAFAARRGGGGAALAGAYVFATYLEIDSGNQNVLEGCYRVFNAFSNATRDGQWPGELIATGTEDYFLSSYYFNAGPFHLENAGYTHSGGGGRGSRMSMYRVHATDPLLFGPAGMRMTWRIGDLNDPATGLKCTLQAGGQPSGNPTESDIVSYAWVYTW